MLTQLGVNSTYLPCKASCIELSSKIGFNIFLSMCPLLEFQTLELSFLVSHLGGFCLMKYHIRFYPFHIWIGSDITHASLNQKQFWMFNLDTPRGKPLPNLNQNWIPSRIQYVFWSLIFLYPLPATYIYSNIWVDARFGGGLIGRRGERMFLDFPA